MLCPVADEFRVSKYGFQEMPLVVREQGVAISYAWLVGEWTASLEARIRRREREANWYGVRRRA